MNNKKQKANRSSVVRIIINNYDQEVIKELEVLHHKRSLLHRFIINDMEYDEENEVIIFKEVISNSEEPLEVKCIKGNIEVNSHDQEIKYIISGTHHLKSNSNRYKQGTLSKSNVDLSGRTVTVNLEVVKHPDQNNPIYNSKRRECTFTTRKLLLAKDLEMYATLCNQDIETIDAQKLFQLKAFLNYRSNFLIYFTLIVKSLGIEGNIYDLSIHNVHKFNELKEKLEERITQILKEKNDNAKEANRILKKNNLRLKPTCQQKLHEVYDFKADMAADVNKILLILIKLRHCLMHYDFTTFSKIYSNQDFIIDNTMFNRHNFGSLNNDDNILHNLLNLEIFKYFSTIKQIKEISQGNTIDSMDQVNLFNRFVDLKVVNRIYWEICEQKPGFNSFINNLIAHDNMENQELKRLFNLNYEKDQLTLENEIQKNYVKKYRFYVNYQKQLNELHNYLNDNDVYAYDIHCCRKYKLMYSEHKELVTEFQGINGKGVAGYNQKLSQLNEKLHYISKLNCNERLRYKLRFAFAFIAKNYYIDETIKDKNNNLFKVKTLDIKKFMQDFNVDTYDITQYSLSDYVEAMYYRYNFDLKNFSIATVKSFSAKFSNCTTSNNNLIKFNSLMYLLLPKEVRGNYLGSVKKYFYDFKNGSHLENMDFYHDLRLFERNIKHYEVFDFSLNNNLEFQDLLTKFKEQEEINIPIVKQHENKDKINNSVDNYLMNYLFRYYANVFTYINEIEYISIYEYYQANHCNSLMEVFEANKLNNYYNFNKLFSRYLSNDQKKAKFVYLRNNIAHQNFVELFNYENIKYCHDKLALVAEDNYVNGKYTKILEKAKHNYEKRLQNLYTHIIVDQEKQRDYILYKSRKHNIGVLLNKVNLKYSGNNNNLELINKLSTLNNVKNKNDKCVYELILRKVIFASFNQDLANLLGRKPNIPQKAS